jgi:hypothetical protein
MLGDRVQLQRITLNLIVDGIEGMSGVTDRSRDLRIRAGQYGGPRGRRRANFPPAGVSNLGGCNFHGCNDSSVVAHIFPVVGSAIFTLPMHNLPKQELALAA